jgi:hypothetical protein
MDLIFMFGAYYQEFSYWTIISLVCWSFLISWPITPLSNSPYRFLRCVLRQLSSTVTVCCPRPTPLAPRSAEDVIYWLLLRVENLLRSKSIVVALEGASDDSHDFGL